MDDNRKKALAAALGQIEKQFGKGSVMRLGCVNPLATYLAFLFTEPSELYFVV